VDKFLVSFLRDKVRMAPEHEWVMTKKHMRAHQEKGELHHNRSQSARCLWRLAQLRSHRPRQVNRIWIWILPFFIQVL
jgi:hypothetical protein